MTTHTYSDQPVGDATIDIGDVEVLSLIPGVGPTALGKAEDAVHVSGETGVAVWAVRKDAVGTLSDASGDYTPFIVDADGRLWCRAILSANSGVDIGDVDVTSVIPGTGATNLGKAEDAQHTSGDVGVMVLGVRMSANGPLSAHDGDYEPLQTDANGHLKVNIIDDIPDTAADDFAHIHANSDTIAGAITGTHMQCDVLDPIPDTVNDDLAHIHANSDTLGTTTGAAVITDVDGTIQQYLRGLVKLWLAGITALPTIAPTPISGAVTDAYVVILSWSCLTYTKKTLMLACPHASFDLNYRIRGYAKSGSAYYDEIFADTTLIHGNWQPFQIEDSYDVITVEVVNTVADAAHLSSFNLSYSGGQ
jgi:hypothetical protein